MAALMDVPTRKQINERMSISVDMHGWPYWTRIDLVTGGGVILNREEAHDLRYAMERICAYLDAREAEDRALGRKLG